MTDKTVFAAMAWGITAILAHLVFWATFIWDIIERWGEALVLEFHTPTVWWLAALVLGRIASEVFKGLTGSD